MAVAAADPYRENLLQQARILSELRRRKARERLIPYVKYTMPSYIAAPFHCEIAEHLEAVERGDIDRLMILAPVRHGKTQLVAKRFPLWYLCKNPTRQVIQASYGGTLSGDSGRELRNLTYSDAHRDVFPNVGLASDSKAVDKWHTTKGGVYIAAGVNGPITGRGFHLGVLDDVLKGQEEAKSEHMREKTWEWLMSDFYTRRMHPNAIVWINTRWHEDDPPGRMLDMMAKGGETWVVLRYRALDDNDKGLCPELVPEKQLIATRKMYRMTGREYWWNALYQNNPTPEEGTFFKKGWLHNWPDKPKREHLKVYIASDWATKEGGGDFTVHLAVGIDPQGDLYVLDMWREQKATNDSTEALLDMIEAWEPTRWAFEKAQIENSVHPFIKQRRKERKIYFGTPVPLSAQGDKEEKAQSIRGRMEFGRVFFPHHAAWWADMKSELLGFPAGKNDDMVDALGMIGRMLHGMQKGTIESGEDEKVPFIGVGDTSDELPDWGREASLDELFSEHRRQMNSLRSERDGY